MEKNELFRIPDPDDPNDPVMPTHNGNSNIGSNIGSAALNTFNEREYAEVERGNNDLESSSSEHEKHNNKGGFAALNIMKRVATCANLNILRKRKLRSRILFCAAPLDSFKGRVVPKVDFELGSSSRKHEKRQLNDTKIEIKKLEKFLGVADKLKDIHVPVPQCCIYKVPKDLRKINEEAYTPQVISIGPFHHGKLELSEMENQKLIYISEFQKREGDEKLMRFKSLIKDNVQHIRNYYQVNSELSNPKFVNMILRDAVFIIEFFLKSEQQEREFDYFLDTACVKAAIACDLQLLENQLPYSLLKKLFEEGAFHNFTKNDHPDHDPFLILSRRFFFDPKDGDFPKPKNEIQHFTDLRRYFLLMDFPHGYQKQVKHVKDLPTATKLHGSGVKFKKVIEDGSSSSRSSLEISCKSVLRTMRIPGFKECEIRIPFTKTLELQIPRLEIDDRSECLYRNMMALELCHYPSETHICNFILLMDYLINNEKDVDLFVEKKIIFSMLGDNAKVATMFNNLCLQITQSFSVYHDIGEKLKEHYVRRWNHTMATLNTVYFGDMWKGTATVAAFILLVLTTIQAVCSIMSLL